MICFGFEYIYNQNDVFIKIPFISISLCFCNQLLLPIFVPFDVGIRAYDSSIQQSSRVLGLLLYLVRFMFLECDPTAPNRTHSYAHQRIRSSTSDTFQ